MNIATKKVFVFDAYGTLFSLQVPKGKLSGILGNQSELLLETWRQKQLEYSWLRASMDHYVPFDEITKAALSYSLTFCGVEQKKWRKEVFDLLMPIYLKAQLIDGAKALLEDLKQKGKQVAILSNGTKEMLQAGIENSGIGNLLDAVLSVEAIQTYKPNPAVYQMALNAFEAKAEEMLFFSSNQWDVAGAGAFGLDAVWIDQYGETKEGLPFGKVLRVKSLKEVIDLV